MNRRKFLKSCLGASSLITTKPAWCANGVSEPMAYGELHNGTNHDNSLPSGLRDLDLLIHGFQQKSLTLISSRPCLGRKKLSLQIALHNAFERKTGTLLIGNVRPVRSSMHAHNDYGGIYIDDYYLETINRSLFRTEYLPLSTWVRSVISDVDIHGIFDSSLEDKERKKLLLADKMIRKSPLWISPCRNLEEGPNIIRSMSREHDIHLVVFIIDMYNPMPDLRYLSQNLKKLSRELNAAIIIATEIESNRVDERKDNRPLLSDIHSGVEENTDQVIFSYRDMIYNEDSPYRIDNEREIVEVHVAKNNFGNCGRVFATKKYAFTSNAFFKDLTTEETDKYYSLFVEPSLDTPKDSHSTSYILLS